MCWQKPLILHATVVVGLAAFAWALSFEAGFGAAMARDGSASEMPPGVTATAERLWILPRHAYFFRVPLTSPQGLSVNTRKVADRSRLAFAGSWQAHADVVSGSAR